MSAWTKSDRGVVASSLLFAAVLAAAWWVDAWYVALLPAALAVLALAIFRLDAYLAVLVAAVPLSMNLEDIGGGGLYLPTEPMLAGALVLLLARVLSGQTPSPLLLRHPVSRWIAASLAWIAFTTLLSWDPLISFKFLVARTWFVVGFFVFGGHLFLSQPATRHQAILLYAFPLAVVVIYTLIRHAGYGFDKDAGHWVMSPFFKDHTSYGAVLAMFIPPVLALVTSRRFELVWRVSIAGLLGILLVGMVLSYTRAAWVSLAAVAVLYGLMQVGFRLKTLLLLGVGGLAGGLLVLDAVLIQLERNDQDSSDDLAEHVESISNVSSDASNLERLNRWSCALALFQEEPLVGWGPGTYQFVYAPFQRSEHRTIISTNNADGGNAHSEYLGPLAEQGIPGALFVVGLFSWVLHLGFRLHRKLRHTDEKRLAMGVFLGLVTYFVHGVLNNYLDTDKASAPFWGFLALLVVWDLEVSRRSADSAESR